MADVQKAPDVHALEDTYEILGELRGSERARKYIAKRRADGTDVMITVVTPPPGSESNELSHFAADIKLLSNLSHPGVAHVFETRWLGKSAALAVISERVQGTTLGEALERKEEFTNPRIASILQEVSGALEWTRGQGVVHRGVTPNDLYFAPGTQRVIVALAPMLIPITGVPDASSDAKTIGSLAWTMLAGRAFAVGEGQPSLAELAPNLAARVVEATDKIVQSKNGEGAPDVPTFLGIVAAGDVLKQAEVEIATQKELYDEEHRAELQKCENHRIEVEQRAAEQAAALAEERAAMVQSAAEQAAAFTDERADFDRIMFERQGQLNSVRAELEKQAAALERRLGEFDARRTEFERFCADEQRRMSDARAAQSLAAATAAAVRAAAAATASTKSLPVAKSAVREEIGEFETNEVKFPDQDNADQKPEEVRGILASLDAPPQSGATSKPSRKRWLVPAVAAAVVVLFVGMIGGIRYLNVRAAPREMVSVGKSKVVTTPPTIDNRGPSRGGFLSQSAGGSLAPRTFGSPPVQPGDSTRAGAIKPDTTAIGEAAATPKPVVRPKPRPVVEPVDPANAAKGAARMSAFERWSRHADSLAAARRDSAARYDTTVRRDTTIGRDTAMPKRDTTMPRRDTTIKPETTYKRGTPFRRDTLTSRP